MSKLKLYLPDNDVLFLEPNALSRLANECYPFTLQEAFRAHKVKTNRYTLDHDYAIKKATAERNLFSLMGWSDKLEDYIR